LKISILNKIIPGQIRKANIAQAQDLLVQLSNKMENIYKSCTNLTNKQIKNDDK